MPDDEAHERDISELHDRIDRLEEKLAWQLAAPTLQKISLCVGDERVARNQAEVAVAAMRRAISSRQESP